MDHILNTGIYFLYIILFFCCSSNNGVYCHICEGSQCAYQVLWQLIYLFHKTSLRIQSSCVPWHILLLPSLQLYFQTTNVDMKCLVFCRCVRLLNFFPLITSDVYFLVSLILTVYWNDSILTCLDLFSYQGETKVGLCILQCCKHIKL